MDTVSLKEYIFENKKIEYILSEIGCHSIKYHPHKEFYSCANYNGDNTTAINVSNNKYLNVVNWTRQDYFKGCSDIFDLVQYNKNCTFVEAVKYVHEILGFEYSYTKSNSVKENKQKFDPLAVFKKALSPRGYTNVADINVIDESILNEYVPILHIDWFKEGITERTREKFGLVYSYRRKRIVVPIRYWLTGELVGFNARTTIPNYKELGIKKYWLAEGYNKRSNLYGYYENKDDIEKHGYCVIYESEKSVLKRDSRNDPTGLALSGKTISDEQVRIILSLNINEVVLAFDNDVCIDEIRFACEKFYRFRKVSYIKDKWNLLGDKDSPSDASNKVYDFLFKCRIEYDESEHQKCLESLGK